MRDELKFVIWDLIRNEKSAEAQAKILVSTLETLVEKHSPVRRKRVKGTSSLWVTSSQYELPAQNIW